MPTGVYKRKNAKPLLQRLCRECAAHIRYYNKSSLCMSCSHKGNEGYWLGKHRPDHPILQEGRFVSQETRKRLSESHKGKKQSPQTIEKRVSQLRGSLNPNWKGGHVKHPDKRIRMSSMYKQWRTHVFKRDDYTCQSCGQHGGKLQADHELPFALYPDLRFEILNGRTLCVSCHKKTHTYGSGVSKMKKEYVLAI